MTILGLTGSLTATVTPPPALDAFGDPVGEEDRSWLVGGCLLAPDASSGPWSTPGARDRADRVDTTWTVYAPPGSRFPPNSTVAIGGVTGNVMGEPQDWLQAGVVVRIRRVEG